MDAIDASHGLPSAALVGRGPLVRAARYDDVLQIRDTLLDALRASDSAYPEPDMPYAVQALLDQIAQGLIAVAVNERDAVVGCIVLSHARWPWTRPDNPRAWFLTNDHFWVEPRSRAGGTAKRLLAWAKRHAEEAQMLLEIRITSIDSATEYKDRFVESQGFVYTGGSHIYDPRSSR